MKVDYTFYLEYMKEPAFKTIFERRLRKIQTDIATYYLPTQNILEEFFVEIFSWTVLPKPLLHVMDTLIASYVPDYTLVDPCSGNSFHTFLFHHFCKREVITVDIQREEEAWIETIEGDGLSYMKDNITSYEDKVLLLSWIDYDDLTVALLRAYTGKMVIGIGNYDKSNAKQYLEELSQHYTLVQHYVLQMPWNSSEHIRIYKKNILSM